jgi:O-antigen ligase
MFGRIQKTIFFLLIFFLPFQVGLHFWPNFSYVGGVRIDYLSPTLYLLDILVVGWILLSARIISVRALPGMTKIFLSLFILDLILNIFLSKSPTAHIFGLIKLGEFGLFGLLVSRVFKKEYVPGFVRTLSLSAIIASVLAIWQFINQSSVGGLWYFLGERTFNSSTIGISTVNLNHQILRAYGAFPHPNVLAFFLLAAIIFTVLSLSYEKSRRWKIFLVVSALFCSVGLLLTFSRISIFLAVFFFLYYFLRKVTVRTRMVILGAASGTLGGLGILGVFGWFGNWGIVQFLLRGIDFREELLAQSLKILSDNPYFGIGLNNFFINQAPLIKTISPINFQPPHNIFVLALLSLGLFGFFIFPAIFILAFRSIFKKLRTTNYELRTFYKSVLFILVSIVIVGMFDHFFLTVEQGQIIFALILGLSFAKIKTNNW